MRRVFLSQSYRNDVIIVTAGAVLCGIHAFVSLVFTFSGLSVEQNMCLRERIPVTMGKYPVL